MIQEELDEYSEIDFSWFYFVGCAKLGLSQKEVGRLTVSMFSKLYNHYKNIWSYEMRMFRSGLTYSEALAKAQQEQEWF